MTQLLQAISGHLGGVLHNMTVVRGRELHGSVGRDDITELTRNVQQTLGADLVFMAGADRRSDLNVFQVHYVFAHPRDRWYLHATLDVPAEDCWIPSLASLTYPASRFEREIRDLLGIEPRGHPDSRPLVRHGFWPEDFFPLRKDASTPSFEDDGQPFPFGEVKGEGVYEIPVGPVHAGIIEPGHFRFSVVGETVIDMKARLYFTHKGTEKLFEGREPAVAVELAERVSGDTTIGHALAFCQAVEAAAEIEVPRRAQFLRVVLLELERLYNHVGDVGAIANDTGYAIANAQCLRIREELLRLNKQLTGSRLMRGVLVPGGLLRDMDATADVANRIDALVADFLEIVEICLENTLLMDRLEGTGRLTLRTARDHGACGYVARASGLDTDIRRDFPFAAYADLHFKVPVFEPGDVLARTRVRIEEAQESASLIRQAIAALPSGDVRTSLPALPPYAPAFSRVEGWRGAIVSWVMAGGDGRLERVKIMDPSFLNWPPLSYALLKNIVPDFPLCNKSFNQSYSGNDL
jgi:Ni,Fe-hydrogenase III large subunit/Ni,Fe-hydrogenase III component G